MLDVWRGLAEFQLCLSSFVLRLQASWVGISLKTAGYAGVWGWGAQRFVLIVVQVSVLGRALRLRGLKPTPCSWTDCGFEFRVQRLGVLGFVSGEPICTVLLFCPMMSV